MEAIRAHVQLFEVPVWFNWGLAVGVTAAAFWKGSWRARVIAGAQLGMFGFSRTLCSLAVCYRGGQDMFPWRYILQDLVLVAVFFACALGARRYWLLWVCSIGLCALVTDLLFLSHIATGWAYASASRIWTYALWALVLSDVWLETGGRGRTVRPTPRSSP